MKSRFRVGNFVFENECSFVTDEISFSLTKVDLLRTNFRRGKRDVFRKKAVRNAQLKSRFFRTRLIWHEGNLFRPDGILFVYQQLTFSRKSFRVSKSSLKTLGRSL